MDHIINVHDLKTNYSKYLERAVGGEKIVLGKHGKAVAMIVPLPQAEQSRTPGALKGKIWASDDFDEPMLGLWDKIGSKQ